jgi:hypothetical protein
MECMHKNSVEFADWIYCVDCNEIIIANISCEHKNTEKRDGGVYCTDCDKLDR